MTDTYSKLMSSIVTSSVWVEPDSTFRVWIALLALKDKDGFVKSSVPGLANLCAFRDPDGNPVPFARALELTQRALDTFLAPDPYSQNKANEGRRIAAGDGGWYVLNHEYFRRLESKEARRESQAEWQRNYRAGKKTGQEKRQRVDKRRQKLTHTDADTKTGKAEAPPQPPEGEGTADAVPGGARYTAAFEAFWAAYPSPHKGSKAKAFAIWDRVKLGAAAAILIADVERRGKEHGEWLREGGRFVPHVTTYLNARTWECEIVPQARAGSAPRDRGSVESGNRAAADIFAGESE